MGKAPPPPDVRASTAAAAAEARATLSQSRGIGDIKRARQLQDTALRQQAAGTNALFGASRRDALRARLDQARAAERHAREANSSAGNRDPVVQAGPSTVRIDLIGAGGQIDDVNMDAPPQPHDDGDNPASLSPTESVVTPRGPATLDSRSTLSTPRPFEPEDLAQANFHCWCSTPPSTHDAQSPPARWSANRAANAALWYFGKSIDPKKGGDPDILLRAVQSKRQQMEDTRNLAGESPPAAPPVLRAATAPPPMVFAHTPTLIVRPVSLRLEQFVAERFSAGEDRQCIVRACEAGGGGDCLFHTIAAALELMV